VPAAREKLYDANSPDTGGNAGSFVHRRAGLEGNIARRSESGGKNADFARASYLLSPDNCTQGQSNRIRPINAYTRSHGLSATGSRHSS
jgi:hypothetical protein